MHDFDGKTEKNIDTSKINVEHIGSYRSTLNYLVIRVLPRFFGKSGEVQGRGGTSQEEGGGSGGPNDRGHFLSFHLFRSNALYQRKNT